ncbi:hypothetical protein [Thermomonas sp.]|uniref:ImmA/IrrE family metallo-endopeptidase n=1 Tax=Thermomonas sp. TaxID=1971895 RepID=UPI00262B0562|nr:hypothetical protein [Thermomonas sp.]MCO5055456.1 ImmA/IrrE family metallo-endopeptidase [Thermomonas sp.]
MLDGHPEHVFRNGGEHASHAGFGSADAIEREADYFSACLLMPKALQAPNQSKPGWHGRCPFACENGRRR